MTIGDDEDAIEARTRFARDLDAPTAFRALGALDPRVELDLV